MGRNHNRSKALLPGERQERSIVHEAERLKRTLLPQQYLDWCRRQCRGKGGLHSSAVRAVVWKDLLLRPDGSVASSSVPYIKAGQPPPPNCHLHVMECDLQRSLWHLFPNEAQRNEKRALVKELLLRTLAHRPELQYFQGLHEVVGFLVFIVGPHIPKETLVSMVDQLLAQHLHLYCHREMKSSESILYAVHFAIADNQPLLAADLERLELGPGTHYALPWLITWFAHHLGESHPNTLARLFDVLISGCEGDDAMSPSSSTASRGATTPATSSTRGGSSLASSSRISAERAVRAASALRSSARSLMSRVLMREPWSTTSYAIVTRRHSHDGEEATMSAAAPHRNATMTGLMIAALILHHGDEIRAAIKQELEASGGDVGCAFGRVFSLLGSLPTRLTRDETMERCIQLAVAMADGVEKGRRSLLSHQEAYCRSHSLNDVAALARAESDSMPYLPTDTLMPARVVRTAIVAAMVGVLALSNFTLLADHS